MPKMKNRGENSKAVEARERKAAIQNEAAEKKKQAEDDAYWADDDKQNAKKQQRKEDKEKKRQEALEKKNELARLADEELNSIKSAKPTPAGRVTRYEVEQRKVKIQQEEAVAAVDRSISMDSSISIQEESEPFEVNMNRLTVEGEARTVGDAITVLSSKRAEVDMHPEKRVKAAYQAFEAIRLPELKKDNNNLRLSQLKQILKKEWQKSPDNPLNARLL